MPVRFLRSSILKWPVREKVLKEAKQWAGAPGRSDAKIEKILSFGSIVKGDWGVGGRYRYCDYPA